MARQVWVVGQCALLYGVAFYTNYTNKNAGLWQTVLPRDPSALTRSYRAFCNKVAIALPVELESAFEYCSDSAKCWPTNYDEQLFLMGQALICPKRLAAGLASPAWPSGLRNWGVALKSTRLQGLGHYCGTEPTQGV
jgi:hypothetical protein